MDRSQMLSRVQPVISPADAGIRLPERIQPNLPSSTSAAPAHPSNGNRVNPSNLPHSSSAASTNQSNGNRSLHPPMAAALSALAEESETRFSAIKRRCQTPYPSPPTEQSPSPPVESPNPVEKRGPGRPRKIVSSSAVPTEEQQRTADDMNAAISAAAASKPGFSGTSQPPSSTLNADTSRKRTNGGTEDLNAAAKRSKEASISTEETRRMSLTDKMNEIVKAATNKQNKRINSLELTAIQQIEKMVKLENEMSSLKSQRDRWEELEKRVNHLEKEGAEQKETIATLRKEKREQNNRIAALSKETTEQKNTISTLRKEQNKHKKLFDEFMSLFSKRAEEENSPSTSAGRKTKTKTADGDLQEFRTLLAALDDANRKLREHVEKTDISLESVLVTHQQCLREIAKKVGGKCGLEKKSILKTPDPSILEMLNKCLKDNGELLTNHLADSRRDKVEELSNKCLAAERELFQHLCDMVTKQSSYSATTRSSTKQVPNSATSRKSWMDGPGGSGLVSFAAAVQSFSLPSDRVLRSMTRSRTNSAVSSRANSRDNSPVETRRSRNSTPARSRNTSRESSVASNDGSVTSTQSGTRRGRSGNSAGRGSRMGKSRDLANLKIAMRDPWE